MIDNCLQSIFECCTSLRKTYGVSIRDADVPQMCAFLLHMKRPEEDDAPATHRAPSTFITAKNILPLILRTKNPKRKAVLAVSIGAALRLREVMTLRFRDIFFTDGTVTVSGETRKNRYAGKVALSRRLRMIMYYY